ncbi:MAG TPA: VOC family protein [Verrucomicrobiae bacterium]|jgi:PhnB protein
MNIQYPIITTYLMLNGRCEEAIEFYGHALDAKVETLLRFKDYPGTPQPGMVPPGMENKIMHSSLRIGGAMVMASDGRCDGGTTKHEGFGLALSVKDTAEADRYFNALLDGGSVVMPQSETFYSPRFGMVTDKFGILWMVMVLPA